MALFINGGQGRKDGAANCFWSAPLCRRFCAANFTLFSCAVWAKKGWTNMKRTKLIAAAICLGLPSLLAAEGPIRTKSNDAADTSTGSGGVYYRCVSASNSNRVTEISHADGAFMAELKIGDMALPAFVATGGGRISFVAIVGRTAYNYSIDPERMVYDGSGTGTKPFVEFGFCSDAS
jgi:hypothetical protein